MKSLAWFNTKWAQCSVKANIICSQCEKHGRGESSVLCWTSGMIFSTVSIVCLNRSEVHWSCQPGKLKYPLISTTLLQHFTPSFTLTVYFTRLCITVESMSQITCSIKMCFLWSYFRVEFTISLQTYQIVVQSFVVRENKCFRDALPSHWTWMGLQSSKRKNDWSEVW